MRGGIKRLPEAHWPGGPASARKNNQRPCLKTRGWCGENRHPRLPSDFHTHAYKNLKQRMSQNKRAGLLNSCNVPQGQQGSLKILHIMNTQLISVTESVF